MEGKGVSTFSSVFLHSKLEFVIKLNDKKSRRFDLFEVIFKCE